MAARIGRFSTGSKIFSIITLALLPLGLVALFASLHATRSASSQRSADLHVALTEGTRKLSAELAADLTAMRGAANALAEGAAPTEVCARLSAVMSAHARRVSQFAVFGSVSAPLCATAGYAPARPSTLGPDSRPRATLTKDALETVAPATYGSAVVTMRYPGATLADFAQPSTLAAPYVMTLSDGQDALVLRARGRGLPLLSETVDAPVGLLDLTLSISGPRVSFGANEVLLTFLPLVMWASAALIGFFVVDRLLIRPLRTLRQSVAMHVPGTQFHLPPTRTPAREIRELGEAFATFSNEISARQAELANALADQTRATREVHHRVKNNLQVIASLISLHARGPHSSDAATAYAAIQRRVDALAIVHRNHYADLDAEGIDIKALLGELATNLRAGAPLQAPAISIGAATIGVQQDIAMAIAFLITELVELSFTIDSAASIAIVVERCERNALARLTLTSLALRASPALTERLAGRYARVIEGLSRQLRAPLSHHAGSGCYAVEFAIVDRSTAA